MINWSEGWPLAAAMIVLIAASAVFSGSEAAFFSLTPRQRRTLVRYGIAGRAADGLLSDSQRLLSTVLFWNLLINMTYFALAAMWANRCDSTGAIIVSVASLVAIIFFSEMLPKSVALVSPLPIAVSMALPLSMATRIVRPIFPALSWANQTLSRLIWPGAVDETEVDLDVIQRAIELGTDDAVLVDRERDALRGLVSLSDIRVGEIMSPRGRLLTFPQPIESSELVDRAIRTGDELGGHVLVTGNKDGGDRGVVTASFPLRQIRPNRIDHPQDWLEEVLHVPWSARASRVLEQLRRSDVDVAVVVDEFGDWMGALTVDSLLHRVLVAGDDETDLSGEPGIFDLGDRRLRVSGDVSVRLLAKRLEIEVEDLGATIVAGFIQRQTGRFPKRGDTAQLEGYQLVVEEDTPAVWVEVSPLSDDDLNQGAG